MRKRFSISISKHFLLFASLFILISSCSTKKKVDTEQVRREIKEREPKKISESEIIDKALTLGAEIALKSQIALSSSLKKAMQEGGVQYAIEFCNLNAYPLIDSLQGAHGAEIRRVTFKTRNEKDAPNALESKILEAYEEAHKNGIELKDHAQILEEKKYVLYTKPIMINNALCLSCHGESGAGLTQEAIAIIREHYPNDKAVGYKMNDFRAMWSIKFLKEGIIKTL